MNANTNYPSRRGWTLGIDASAWQGEISKEDMLALKPSGAAWLCHRASMSESWFDSVAYRNLMTAHECGFMRQAYHLFYANRDPVKQAEWFFESSHAVSDLRPAMDFESLEGVSCAHAAKAAHAFLMRSFELWGQKLFFYTYPGFLNMLYLDKEARAYVLGAREFSDLWLAMYKGLDRDFEKELPPTSLVPSWPSVAWQFDGDKGLTLGSGKDIDFDFFFGDRAALVSQWGVNRDIKPIDRPVEVQRALLILGYALPRFGADGKPGAETKAAIMAFQEDIGLSPDGEITPLVKEHLTGSLELLRERARIFGRYDVALVDATQGGDTCRK